MRRTIKKYQTPSTTLPSILEEGIPTQQDALIALLNEMKLKERKKDVLGPVSTDANLIQQAATRAALDDMMEKQNAASEEMFSKSVDAYRSVVNGLPVVISNKNSGISKAYLEISKKI